MLDTRNQSVHAARWGGQSNSWQTNAGRKCQWFTSPAAPLLPAGPSKAATCVYFLVWVRWQLLERRPKKTGVFQFV